MKTIDSATMQRNFGEYMFEAFQEDLMVKKYNRDFVAVISAKRYNNLIALEEKILLESAKIADKKGYIGSKKSKKLLSTILNS